MPSDHQQAGTDGEALAQKYLEELGYRTLEKQWHSRYGEIDLIMMEGDELVFVEVKLRSTSDYGHPEDMINRAKTGKLKKTALEYVERQNTEFFWRFDTIAITLQGNNYEIFHLKDTIRDDRL